MTPVAIGPPPLPRVVLARDVGRDVVRRACATGALSRIRTGAYTDVVGAEKPWELRRRQALARVVAASQVLTSRYAFSHATAALIHGLWLWSIETTAHVTRETRAGGRTAPDLRCHTARLSAEDVVVVNGLPTTSLARTIEDCALTMHPRDALVVVDSALRLIVRPDRHDRRGTKQRLDGVRRQLLARLERRGKVPGRRRARAILMAADPHAESPGESVLRWIAVACGLPQPEPQVRVDTPRGIYYTDVTCRVVLRGPGDGSERVLIAHLEFDGAVKYGGDASGAAQAVLKEKLREDAIRALGHIVCRFTYADLRDEQEVVRRVLAALPPGHVIKLEPVPTLRPVAW